MKKLYNRARNKYFALMGATAASLAPITVFAQSAPDTAAIEAELTTYKTAVVALVIAFAVVLWAVKAAGLLKPRG